MNHDRDINCGNCEAACCRRETIMGLKLNEVDFLRSVGTNLEPYNEAPKRQPPRIFRLIGLDRQPQAVRNYILTSDCGHLGQDEDGYSICNAYADPKRPTICRAFMPGSYACRLMRVKSGVDPVEEWKQYVTETSEA